MSADATWPLQQAIYTALTGDTDLMAAISGVYDHVPADTAFPYVTIGETTVTDWSSKSFDGQAHSLTLHIWSRARGRKETKEVMALIYDVLNGSALAVDGQQLVDLRFDFAQTLLDTDGLTFHGIQRYRAVTRALAKPETRRPAMAAETGRAFLLKIGDGQPTESFTTIAGMRSTRLSINSELVDITNKDSAGWRELLANGGVRKVSLSGAGVFTNSQAELDLQAKVLAGAIANYQIVFESGDMFAGAFLVSGLDYSGEHNGERSYTMSLESSGPVTFTQA